MVEPLFGGDPDAHYQDPNWDDTSWHYPDGTTSADPPTPPAPGKTWFQQALDDIMASIKVIADDPEKRAMTIAAGLAAGSTYLLFYTDVPEAAVTAAGNAVPDSFNLEVGL